MVKNTTQLRFQLILVTLASLFYVLFLAPCFVNSNAYSYSIKVPSSEQIWRNIREGLDIAELNIEPNFTGSLSENGFIVTTSNSDNGNELTLVRINPTLFEFSLHMASEDGKISTIQRTAARHGLAVAINAGMYLPDGMTNTGLMQSATHANNKNLANRLGAFFLAQPTKTELTNAILTEKDELGVNLKQKLADYSITVQNFRLISSTRQVLWPQKGTSHSIAAMARDDDGNIIFILSRFTLKPSELAKILLALPIKCNLTMYLEGGVESALLVKDEVNGKSSIKLWRGRRDGFFKIDSFTDAFLPNVIGVKPIQ